MALTSSAEKPPFRALPLILMVLLTLLGISLANQWYADNIAMPRYCEEPVQTTMGRIQRLLKEKTPAEEDFKSRRPYIVAAKLLFLLPRGVDESETEYLARIQRHLLSECSLQRQAEQSPVL